MREMPNVGTPLGNVFYQLTRDTPQEVPLFGDTLVRVYRIVVQFPTFQASTTTTGSVRIGPIGARHSQVHHVAFPVAPLRDQLITRSGDYTIRTTDTLV